MRLHNLDNTSIKYYLSEELRKDSALNEQWDRIDTEFFKPWQQYLNEAAITPDQLNQIFAAAEKEAAAGGGNSTMLGKIVDKIIPDAFLGKLEKALPTPDPKAAADPEFEAKATAAVNNLEAPAETKTGLMAVVKAAVKNPQAQAVILSLVGGVLGGLMSKAGPLISTIFPGGGTAAVAITGALVAGGVAIAAAKLQGKPWKEAFKGAIKPALAGAAGAVIGQFAAGIAGAAVDKVAGSFKGSGTTDAPAGQLGGDIEAGLAADQAKQDRLLNKYPPDKGFTFAARGNAVEVFDANGTKVFAGDIPLKTMDARQFADLTNNGKMATPGISSGSISGDPMAGISNKSTTTSGINVANEPVIPGQPLSQQQMAVVDMSRSMGNTPGPEVQAAYDLAKQPANPMANKTRMPGGGNYGDPTGMGAASDYQPADTGSLRQGGAPGGVAFPGDPGYKPNPMANKTRMPKGAESIHRTGQPLSEGQIYMIFNRVVARNDRLLTEGWLAEGVFDKIKQFGKNLTTKVTADKLNSAWVKAGSKLDSDAVATVLKSAGVNDTVVSKVYGDLKLPAPAAAGAEKPFDLADLEKQIGTFDLKQKQDILAYLTKSLRTA